MNRDLIKQYIEHYKNDFEKVNQKEIYKWKAVKCFQDFWDIEANDFSEMLTSSIALTGNLLKSGNYYAFKMIQLYSERKPEVVRDLFKYLYNEDLDLYHRIKSFRDGIRVINNDLFSGYNSFQDDRAIVVYLTLRYPERYFFYKYEMFKSFSTKVQLSYYPIMGRVENIGYFNNYCDLVKFEISQDQDLLKLHKSRITNDCYYDDNFNILTQDFIYAISNHLEEIPIGFIGLKFRIEHEEAIDASVLRTTISVPNFKGKIINFTQRTIENKRIGDLGELWVMEYEKHKLNLLHRPDLANKVDHASKTEGDGIGFDIKSFDELGNSIFIEVKTTSFNKDRKFYITRNELERSKKEKDNYYVYRLYNYNEKINQSNLLKIRGNLNDLCVSPVAYDICFSE